MCRWCGNARFNAHSLKKRSVCTLARPAYRGLTVAWAQTDEDADRLRTIGTPVGGVFDNLKFDVVPDGIPMGTRPRMACERSPPGGVVGQQPRGRREALWLDV